MECVKVKGISEAIHNVIQPCRNVSSTPYIEIHFNFRCEYVVKGLRRYLLKDASHSTVGNCVTINIQIYHNIQHENLPILSGFGHYAITSYMTPSWKCRGCIDSTVLPSRNACLVRPTCHCSNKF